MINCARRAALRGISQRVFSPCRGMVDIAQKERGEEAAYIHRKELERAEQAQLRKSMEEILSRKDGDEQKTKLKEIIDKQTKTEDLGIMQRLGLTDWTIAVPAGLVFGVPLLSFQVIELNTFFFVAGSFALFWHAARLVYIPLYDEIVQHDTEKALAHVGQAEDAAYKSLNDTIESLENLTGVKENFQTVFELEDEVSKAAVEAFRLKDQATINEAFTRKLEQLASLEQNASLTLRNDMIETVKSTARQTFNSDKKQKDAALASAISALQSGKRGKDVVADVFTKAIADYKNTADKADSNVSKIMAKFEADIEGIVQPPEVHFAGFAKDKH